MEKNLGDILRDVLERNETKKTELIKLVDSISSVNSLDLPQSVKMQTTEALINWFIETHMKEPPKPKPKLPTFIRLYNEGMKIAAVKELQRVSHGNHGSLTLHQAKWIVEHMFEQSF